MEDATQPPSRRRLGLTAKLTVAILAAGTVPIVVGLWVAYVQGSDELTRVIGQSFEALAQETAARIDREIRELIDADAALALRAAADTRLRAALDRGLPGRVEWPGPGDPSPPHPALLGSWVTGPDAEPAAAEEAAVSAPPGTRITGFQLAPERQRFAFRISTPIRDAPGAAPIGWLDRAYDVRIYLNPLVYPVRFGKTGHMMLIDNRGMVISCPLLPTGSRVPDTQLVRQVVGPGPGWVTAASDGHGGHKTSLIGHAPVSGVNGLLEDGVWATFVWQDSGEIFAPARSLRLGIAWAGLLAVALLGLFGYYATRRIVRPIRRLHAEAGRIAEGDLNRPLAIRTGDEIEDLASQFDHMRRRLRELIGRLEEKVETRTRELIDTQAEKDQVIEQLIQAEKLAAIGTMASGIGHEINNPLYAIVGRAEAIRDASDLERCHAYGDDILKQAKHIAETVKTLSGYARPGSLQETEAVDVNERVAEAVSMARHSLIHDQVQVDDRLTPVPPIRARPDEVQQAFFNVVRNAMQAMDGKGVLTLESGEEDGMVTVTVRDTGPGIPEADAGRIFDPFFTTKGPEAGEGLGLYIARQIARKYGGTIELESRGGQGATVTFRFPAARVDETEEEA